MARQGKARVLNPHEIKSIFKIAETTRYSKRNIAMLHASYSLAMRACEIRRIRVCDVIEKDEESLTTQITLLKTMTKTKKIRQFPFINKMARKAFQEYLIERRKEEGVKLNRETPLFLSQKGDKKGFTKTSIIHLFEYLHGLINLKGASSHSGRRSFITLNYRKFLDIQAIADFVGHSAVSTTYGYVDVDYLKIEKIAENNLF
jgi:integrase/recombinase XerD